MTDYLSADALFRMRRKGRSTLEKGKDRRVHEYA
jgi:hypothetical protein